MLRATRWGYVVASLLVLGACAMPYQPARGAWSPLGYSSTNVDATRVDVRYYGRAYVGTVRHYAMYRCAEITQERGFDGFVVESDRGSGWLSVGMQVSRVDIRMRMFKGSTADARRALTDVSLKVYDAARVRRILEPLIER